MKVISARFEFKVEDSWIGVFWKHTEATVDSGKFPLFTDIWVCFVPWFPLHIMIQRRWPSHALIFRTNETSPTNQP